MFDEIIKWYIKALKHKQMIISNRIWNKIMVKKDFITWHQKTSFDSQKLEKLEVNILKSPSNTWTLISTCSPFFQSLYFVISASFRIRLLFSWRRHSWLFINSKFCIVRGHVVIEKTRFPTWEIITLGGCISNGILYLWNMCAPLQRHS